MSDLPDRLWSAAYEKLPPPEELTELLVEAASQIVQDAWWKQTFKEMWAKRAAPSPAPPPAPESVDP